MKTTLVRFTLAAMIACVAQCAALPIRGKACYQSAGGEICVGADPAGIVVTGNFPPAQ